MINSVISAYYYLGPVVAMYFGKEETPLQKGAPPQDRRASATCWPLVPRAVLAVIWIAFLCVALLGLFPSNILDFIQTSASSWLVALN